MPTRQYPGRIRQDGTHLPRVWTRSQIPSPLLVQGSLGCRTKGTAHTITVYSICDAVKYYLTLHYRTRNSRSRHKHPGGSSKGLCPSLQAMQMSTASSRSRPRGRYYQDRPSPLTPLRIQGKWPTRGLAPSSAWCQSPEKGISPVTAAAGTLDGGNDPFNLK